MTRTKQPKASKPKVQVMWGCWVRYKDGREEWGSLAALKDGFADHYPCIVPFTMWKGDFKRMVEHYRKWTIVKSATVKKVTLPVPEGK